MRFRLFGKKPRKKPRKVQVGRKRQARLDEKFEKHFSKMCTKDDVKLILNEIASSREAVIKEVTGIPDSISGVMAEQITSPLRDFISSELSSYQAVKQVDSEELSSYQAVKQEKSLDDVVQEMKKRLDMLSQRHLKILQILVQNNGEWLDYEEIGKFCSPQLTGSCIRGYVADLLNSYKIPIQKEIFGRKSRIKISEEGLKQLAVTKLLKQ
ncbi:MAG: hypothetical protein ISS93_03405 [Candidatus Aenigmarchaeota archaeon]|nr:hypothetical protein [Candidatus Aenigmarchaeota archaeon]